jgi:hypothetical protein
MSREGPAALCGASATDTCVLPAGHEGLCSYHGDARRHDALLTELAALRATMEGLRKEVEQRLNSDTIALPPVATGLVHRVSDVRLDCPHPACYGNVAARITEAWDATSHAATTTIECLGHTERP